MYGSKTEQRSEVSRIQQLQDQVARLQAGLKSKKPGKGDKEGSRTGGQCQTCPQGNRHEGKPCLGKKAKDCYGCKEPGHFKGAHVCKAMVENPKSKKVRQLKDIELSDTDS